MLSSPPCNRSLDRLFRSKKARDYMGNYGLCSDWVEARFQKFRRCTPPAFSNLFSKTDDGGRGLHRVFHPKVSPKSWLFSRLQATHRILRSQHRPSSILLCWRPRVAWEPHDESSCEKPTEGVAHPKVSPKSFLVFQLQATHRLLRSQHRLSSMLPCYRPHVAWEPYDDLLF